MADFDIGSQARLDVVSNGVVLFTSTITRFGEKKLDVEIKRRPLNGPPVYRKVPDGWEGDFEMDRLGPTLDDYFSREEDDYYVGIAGAAILITKTVAEQDGSVSQYRHEGVVLKFESSGDHEQTKEISQKVSFMSSRRPKVS